MKSLKEQLKENSISLQTGEYSSKYAGYIRIERAIEIFRDYLKQKQQEHKDVPEMVYFIQKAYMDIFDKLIGELDR